MASYRPWLRDEFAFRCAYCLIRERWGRVSGEFDLDHFVPQIASPGSSLEYTNLVYACGVCNGRKGIRRLPDVCSAMTGAHVKVVPNGELVTETPEAEEIVHVLLLNSTRFVQWRRMWIRNIEMAAEYDRRHYRQLMSYPDDLPNLAARRPARNTKPDGVEQSHYARRQRGELPEMYEY